MASGVIEQALGERFSELAAPIQRHFRGNSPPSYRGTVNCWRRGGVQGLLLVPVLRLLAGSNLFFAETGPAEFELPHPAARLVDGRPTLTWRRTFQFASARRVFEAVMTYDLQRASIVDRMGSSGWLESELKADVTEDGALVIRSGKQWLCWAGLRLPIPMLLRGDAVAIESARPDGSLSMDVVIANSLLGRFFGYRGSFNRVEEQPPLPTLAGQQMP